MTTGWHSRTWAMAARRRLALASSSAIAPPVLLPLLSRDWVWVRRSRTAWRKYWGSRRLRERGGASRGVGGLSSGVFAGSTSWILMSWTRTRQIRSNRGGWCKVYDGNPGREVVLGMMTRKRRNMHSHSQLPPHKGAKLVAPKMWI